MELEANINFLANARPAKPTRDIDIQQIATARDLVRKELDRKIEELPTAIRPQTKAVFESEISMVERGSHPGIMDLSQRDQELAALFATTDKLKEVFQLTFRRRLVFPEREFTVAAASFQGRVYREHLSGLNWKSILTELQLDRPSLLKKRPEMRNITRWENAWDLWKWLTEEARVADLLSRIDEPDLAGRILSRNTPRYTLSGIDPTLFLKSAYLYCVGSQIFNQAPYRA